MIAAELLDRMHRHACEWGVTVDDVFETETSVIAFGHRGNEAVVLKVIKRPGDEWWSGQILEAFNGKGIVRVHAHTPGAVLMERLMPGSSLARMALDGEDEKATSILADVIRGLAVRTMPISPAASNKSIPTIRDWGKGFQRYIANGDDRIAPDLVEAGQRMYLSLCDSQRAPRLLHGDLQHYNVLFDAKRGWLAIDPKGVMGELEFEIGPVLRNPHEQAEQFLSPAVIERRLKQFAGQLNLDFARMLKWAFAQAVLSAIWEIEEGHEVNAANPALRLAQTLQTMLG